MKLFIAEKPAMARDIAKVLGEGKKHDGYIKVGNDVITWCIGHILQQADPDKYDKKYKYWRVEHLPIIPAEWQMEVSEGYEKQFNVIKALIEKAEIIVHAGDPDREGQLLVDEVLEYVDNKIPVKRLLLNALDAESINKALNNLRDNKDFEGLKNSALGRSRADWLVGMNFTRLFTLLAKKYGHDSVFSVGRVQTPTLMLVAMREKEIREFKPQKYYGIRAVFEVNQAQQLESAVKKIDVIATWKPCESVDTVDGKITDESIISNCRDKLNSYANKEHAVISNCSKRTKKEPVPLPYSLATLQIDAGKKFGYSPKVVLDTVQALYDKTFLTYPRSECEFLPEAQFADANDILLNIRTVDESLGDMVGKADAGLKGRAWNDSETGKYPHHAIMPTKIKVEALNEKESNIYTLVAKRYALQFFKPYVYEHAEIEFNYAREIFIATGNITVDLGWKRFMKDGKEKEETTLPDVNIHDGAEFLKSELTEKTTKCPVAYTEGTLLEAMTEVYKYVANEALKERLKSVEGLGTSATRAGIIQGLIDKKYLLVEKKKVLTTQKAGFLLNVIPQSFNPEMTAIWESQLNNIKDGNGDVENFLRSQKKFISEICDSLRDEAKIAVQGENCPECGEGVLVKKEGKHGKFKACNRYPECKYVLKNEKVRKTAVGEKCPDCDKGILVERNGKYGKFKACSNYPVCKYIKKAVKQ